MTDQNTTKGIWLMIATVAIFALQDGVSRYLGGKYSIYMVVMIRFWFFALFALFLSARQTGGIKAQFQTRHPALQITRGLLLITEVCVMIASFVMLGLIATHAVFVCYPLLVAALSGPLLKEHVGWRRWCAIIAGFVGVLIILKPDQSVLSTWAALPFIAALLFALYGLLTRYVARDDSTQTCFLWTGIIAALAITPLGLWHWNSIAAPDWLWLGLLCLLGAWAHFMMIRAYELAEASDIQPFALLQLVFIAILGLALFGESISLNIIIGSAIVMGAALFTMWRNKMARRKA